MDPLTAAGTFATIVGLLSNFKAERSGTELTEFTTWLKEKHYEEVAGAIERNSILSQELSNILATNHSLLVERLSQLDNRIAQLASQFEGFGSLANALNSKPPLSEQAISVLEQLVKSGAEYFMERKVFTGDPDEYLLIGGTGGKLRYSDRRFIKDDLDSLVSAALVRLDVTSKGSRKFFVTRAAAEFFK
ncbi:hypothetical protein [Ectothiorhodospira shaposhnikovii]|uniref:hypothetical protein n=1 Tax=Ectothiorhodospira shaposhnikovii TaxID=1054 RepID=UPI001EE95446|nr:hypothetical protein [Ectothiorhodospira shaposhnikovii]MCG5512015.1 hypothetical protein [Ectothiorhodospira shaposhnikovii]